MLYSNPEKRTQMCEDGGLLDELGMKDVGRVVGVVGVVEVEVITIDVVEVMDAGIWSTWLRKVCSKVTYLRYVLSYLGR